mmetsp:Transcript_33179/g.53425  ORF Transcript_33179/g.53425 Transcript_33179/m.53425 type:complete len:261 (+) Transcript_33179:483-1265(+)
MLLEPVVSCLEANAISGLVSKGPHDDTGVVLVTFERSPSSLQVRLYPFLSIAERRVTLEADAMGLDVGFIDHIQAMLVTQLVPVGIFGMVRVSDSIEIVHLHEANVFQHVFFADDSTSAAVELAVIHAPNEELPAVHAEPAVSNLNGAKPNPVADHLRDNPLFLKGDQEGVELWHLRTPRLHPLHLLLTRKLCSGSVQHEFAERLITISQKLNRQLAWGPAALPRQLGVNLQRAVSGGTHCEVLQMLLGPRIDLHISRDS